MITVEQYNAHLIYAQDLTKGSNIDPFDVVHTALLANENCSKKEVKNIFWQLHRENLCTIALEPEDSAKKKTKTRTKICTKCREDLPCSAFTYKSRGKYQTTCDTCLVKRSIFHAKNNREAYRVRMQLYYQIHKESIKQRAKARRESDPEYMKEWRKKNRSRLRENDSKWRKANAEKVKKYDEKRREWRKNNPEKAKQYSAKCNKKNREKRVAYAREWRKNNPDKVKQYQLNNKKNHSNGKEKHKAR